MKTGFDPYDTVKKLELHSQADAKNFVDIRRGKLVLRCGAKKKESRGGGLCKSLAGSGTDHSGYGRCKFCGGKSTGPKTANGIANVKGNAVRHGFYSKGLSADEQYTYHQILRSDDLISLREEIAFLKTKILSYITRWNLKQRGAGYEGTIQWYKDGMERSFYHAGSIEDKPLMRSFEHLGRLVEKQARLTGEDKEDILRQINDELRAASLKETTASWEEKRPPHTVERQ